MADTPQPDFFVGYLPTPPRTARRMRIIAIALCIASIIAAIAITTLRRNPGRGTWDDSTKRTFTGIITTSPFPSLHLTEAAGDLPIGTALLLVEEGKFGARRAVAFDGKRSRVQGFLLQRDQLAMIELTPELDALVHITDTSPATTPATIEASGSIELTGEIVDIKCYIGAMKPGDGLVHRPCAILCISGGIPPVLISRDAAGSPIATIITAADGSPLSPQQQRLIGLPVRLRGTLSTLGTLRTLRLSAIELIEGRAMNLPISETNAFCLSMGLGASLFPAPSINSTTPHPALIAARHAGSN